MEFLNKLLGSTPAKKATEMSTKSKKNAGPVTPGVVLRAPTPPPIGPAGLPADIFTPKALPQLTPSPFQDCNSPTGLLASPNCDVAFVREFVEEIVDNASALSDDDQSQWSELSYNTASVGVTASVGEEPLTHQKTKNSDTDSDSISFQSADDHPAPVNKNNIITEAANNSFGLTEVIGKLEAFNIATPCHKKKDEKPLSQIFSNGEGNFAADDSDLDTSGEIFEDSQQEEEQVTILVDNKPCSVSFSSCDDGEQAGEQTPRAESLTEEQLVVQALLQLESAVNFSELPQKKEVTQANSVSLAESKKVSENLPSPQATDTSVSPTKVDTPKSEAFIVDTEATASPLKLEPGEKKVPQVINTENCESLTESKEVSDNLPSPQVTDTSVSPTKVDTPKSEAFIVDTQATASPLKLEPGEKKVTQVISTENCESLTESKPSNEVSENLPSPQAADTSISIEVDTPKPEALKFEAESVDSVVEFSEKEVYEKQLNEVISTESKNNEDISESLTTSQSCDIQVTPTKVATPKPEADTVAKSPILVSEAVQFPVTKEVVEKQVTEIISPENSVSSTELIQEISESLISQTTDSPTRTEVKSPNPKAFKVEADKVATSPTPVVSESIDLKLSPIKVETSDHLEASFESSGNAPEAALSDLLSRCEQQQKALDCLAEEVTVNKEEENLEALLSAEAERVCEEINNASMILDGDMSDTLEAPCAPPRKSVTPRRTASPCGPAGDCEDPFKPRARITSFPPRDDGEDPFKPKARITNSPPRDGTSPGASMTSSGDSAVMASSSGKLQRDLSSESAGSPKSIPSMDSGICGAEVNHSEAGPDIASQEVFVSSEIFKDPNAFEFLSNLGGRGNSNVSCSRLERESLYVKFDPLVAARDRKVYLSPCMETSRGSDAGDSPNAPRQQEMHRVLENHSDKDTSPGTVGTLVNLGTPTPPGRVAREYRETPKSAPQNSHEGKESSPGPTMQQVGFAQELLDRQARVFEERLARLAEQHEQQLAAQKARMEEEAETTRRETGRLTKQLATMAAAETQMSLVVKEYEDTISRILVDKEHAKEEWSRERASLESERNQAQQDLAGAELAFADLHQKYERAKVAIQGFKSNETELRQSNLRFQEKIQQSQEMYKKLKEHAEAKLAEASQENDEVVRAKEMEAAASNAQIKQLKARIKSLEETLAMREKENQELINICDELVAKVGHS